MIENVTAGRSAPFTHSALDALCSCDHRQGDVLQVTIVCAHPDDETLGAAGRLPHLRDVEVVHVTDGAPRDMTDAIANGFGSREAYARARAAERDQALALAAVPLTRIRDLGLIDQEASFQLIALTQELVRLFERTCPDLVLTHAYEGGHPDHDAVAFAVHSATELVATRSDAAPLIAEFTGYHWRDGAMQTGCFLPRSEVPERSVSLGKDERRLKETMLDCYVTQRRVIASFTNDLERFRLAPAYDFTMPPHDGRLFYEWFDWRVTGVEWRRLASAAKRELGVVRTAC